MFSEVSICRSQILSRPPVSLVYAAYLPSGVITALAVPAVEKFSDLNGIDRSGGDDEAIDRLRAMDNTMTSEPAMSTNIAAIDR